MTLIRPSLIFTLLGEAILNTIYRKEALTKTNYAQTFSLGEKLYRNKVRLNKFE